MASERRQRVVIERVKPEIDGGRFPIKRAIGEEVKVRAGIFVDGHDQLSAVLLYRRADEKDWRETAMEPLVNDEWEGAFIVEEKGLYHYTLKGWVDHFRTWQKDLKNPDSVASKLWARFSKCGVNVSRRGYDAY